MPEFADFSTLPRPPLFSTRKIVHISMLCFAFLLPYLTWTQAAGCALLALVFNVVVLPHLAVDMRQSPSSAPGSSVWTGIVIYPISVIATASILSAPPGPSWRWGTEWRVSPEARYAAQPSPGTLIRPGRDFWDLSWRAQPAHTF